MIGNAHARFVIPEKLIVSRIEVTYTMSVAEERLYRDSIMRLSR